MVQDGSSKIWARLPRATSRSHADLANPKMDDVIHYGFRRLLYRQSARGSSPGPAFYDCSGHNRPVFKIARLPASAFGRLLVQPNSSLWNR